MANVCCFEGKLKGRLKDIVEFSHIADSKSPKHLGWRVSCFEIQLPESIQGHENETLCLDFYGDCAWSVYSCMFPGEHSDISHKAESQEAYSLPELCKELGVEVELFSTEPGCCFAEHYHISSDGEEVVNDCVDYSEFYIGECESYEDFIEKYDSDEITREQFETAKQIDGEILVICELFDDGWPYQLESDEL